MTNGVHMPTWDSVDADRLWENACGKDRWRGKMDARAIDFHGSTDSDLWQMRSDSRKSLVEYVRKKNARQLAGRGASGEDITRAAQVLDADILTLGFARRFAPYKRPTLLLHDSQRLIRILTNQARPVQLVLAGKAHPQDAEGQNMIRQWIEFARSPEVRSRVVFLSDYDALMAEHLVQGVDVWLNTPQRPWEASGTSGMKVLVNGGLNLSELDGWWAEAYSPKVGWAIGDGQEHGEDPSWDAAEAETLYGLLEREVIPEFYSRNEKGIPEAWVRKMRDSMSQLTPAFSTNRVVCQYADELYLSSSANYLARSADNGRLGMDLLNWQKGLSKHWPEVRFGSTSVSQQGEQFLFQVQIYFGGLDPEAVQVDLFAQGPNGEAPLRQPMNRGDGLAGSPNGFLYSVRVPKNRPASDFTPRVIAQRKGAILPLEAPFILWDDAPAWR